MQKAEAFLVATEPFVDDEGAESREEPLSPEQLSAAADYLAQLGLEEVVSVELISVTLLPAMSDDAMEVFPAHYNAIAAITMRSSIVAYSSAMYSGEEPNLSKVIELTEPDGSVRYAADCTSPEERLRNLIETQAVEEELGLHTVTVDEADILLKLLGDIR